MGVWNKSTSRRQQSWSCHYCEGLGNQSYNALSHGYKSRCRRSGCRLYISSSRSIARGQRSASFRRPSLRCSSKRQQRTTYYSVSDRSTIQTLHEVSTNYTHNHRLPDGNDMPAFFDYTCVGYEDLGYRRKPNDNSWPHWHRCQHHSSAALSN